MIALSGRVFLIGSFLLSALWIDHATPILASKVSAEKLEDWGCVSVCCLCSTLRVIACQKLWLFQSHGTQKQALLALRARHSRPIPLWTAPGSGLGSSPVLTGLVLCGATRGGTRLGQDHPMGWVRPWGTLGWDKSSHELDWGSG